MSKHQLTYIDLHPQPVEAKEPSTLAIWTGAALALVAVNTRLYEAIPALEYLQQLNRSIKEAQA